MNYTDENMKIASWLAYQGISNVAVNRYHEDNKEYPTVLKALELSGITRPDDSEMTDGEKEIWDFIENDPYYSSWKISGVKDENSSCGFYALLIETEPDKAVVAFRGTELTGGLDQIVDDFLKADLGLAIQRETEQQEKAAEFMQEIYETYDYSSYALAGHSLGGNLAVHSLLSSPEEMWDMIERCYSMDGPGASQDYLDPTSDMAAMDQLLVGSQV